MISENDLKEIEDRPTMSPREIEVLALLAQGLPNKLIADRLHLSPHTVKYHMDRICKKMRTDGSRVLAAVKAVRWGLV